MSLHMAYAVKKRQKMASGGPVCQACRGGTCMEHGGMVGADDMVSRIMTKRKGYSEGGKVANDTPPIVDEMPADYDVLAKDDDLEFHETGANSGDEEGGLADDDMIDRIMMKRKRDRNPVPA